MYDKSQTTAIFTAAQNGLQNTLQYLLQNNSSGITRTTLTNAIASNNTGINSSFFQMINSQFSTLDTDNDGTLTSSEATAMINNLSTGVTRDQVYQLLNAGSIDEDLANKIISNFAKMDTNGDGKVSESEINEYCINEEISDKQDESTERLISNMSCYYDTDSTSKTDSDEEE